MGLIKISKRKDVHFEYTDGYSEVKALPGECEEATITRCSLLPGKSIKPNVYSTVEHTQVFMFLTGKGYVVTPRKGFNVKNEFAIFVPDYDTENFEIVCSTDSKTPLEYLHIVTKLNDYDKYALWNSKMRLPRFRTLDDGWSYYESFKKENITSKMLLEHRNLGRVSCGAVLGEGPCEVGQHIHTDILQWYIVLPGSRIQYTAGDESVVLEGGDISYTPCGYYHGTKVENGDALDYIWFEMVKDLYPGEID